MERVIEARRPAPSKSEGLSTVAKFFFGLNIFQVIAIGGIQGAMIVFGNFKPVSEGGLGPGRRIYMALFLGAVLYSCFLCLFAVKKQNFLEILAFVLQNYAYIIYSGIQVYHISFKTYEDHDIERQIELVYLTVIDSIGLLVLNIIFTCLAAKLFGEYGWKIYKRVRFNIRLRAAFHLYETVLMLLKMQFMFITMFAICLNQTLLYDRDDSFSYVASLLSIPVCLIVSIIGVVSIRRENKYVASFVILGILSAIVYFVFKMARVATKKCTGCSRMETSVVRDIPGEVDLHILYLGSVNLILLLGLFVAFIKVVRNFGIGLAAHFEADVHSKLTVLSLSRNVLASIVTSSGEEQDASVDLDTPRPSVSSEPRPSVFQYLPRFIGTSNHYFEDPDQSKSLSLPAHLQKRDNIAKQIGRSAKSRISQIFWESDFSRLGSHRSSVTSTHYSSCFRDCCPSLRGRRSSVSVYIVPEEDKAHGSCGIQSGGQNLTSSDRTSTNNGPRVRQRKRSKSMGGSQSFARYSLSRRRFGRVNSLPCDGLLRYRPSKLDSRQILRFSASSESNVLVTAPTRLSAESPQQSAPKIIVSASSGIDGSEQSFDVVSLGLEPQDSPRKEKLKPCLSNLIARPNFPRRSKSSTPGLLSMRTEVNGSDRDNGAFERDLILTEQNSRSRQLGVAERSTESPDRLRRALSDYDLLKKPDKRGRVHFAY